MNPEDFRRHGHALIDWIADYRGAVEERPVRAAVQPGQVKASLPGAAPEAPEPAEQVMADLEALVVPGLTHWQHPSFFGWFPANADLSSVLGDLASSGLGVLGLSWVASPALTELEEVVVDWSRQLLGLSGAWRGVIQDTASTSTLVALLCGRERATGYAFGAGPPTAVYASSHAHSSVRKAALLAGMRFREIPVGAGFALLPDALAAAMAADAAEGVRPAAVVVTTGTTTTTAVDPIQAVVDVALQHGAWVHVDAAMAGTAQLLPEARWMWEGVEGADSIVWNAHKWLGAVFDCSVYFLRDPQHLTRVMSTNPSYLRTAVDDQVANLRDWGLPLGRRFRALKLWYLLRTEGAERLRARIRRDLENARVVEAHGRPRSASWRTRASAASSSADFPLVSATCAMRSMPAATRGAVRSRVGLMATPEVPPAWESRFRCRYSPRRAGSVARRTRSTTECASVTAGMIRARA